MSGRLLARLLTLLGRGFRARPNTPAHFRHVMKLAEQKQNATSAGGPQATELLISLVAPVYDAQPRYLDDLLASFLAQPPGLCELILSDDGSSSARTLSWLGRHERTSGLTLVRAEQNRGIAAATNAGIQKASGQWIALVDHDDALAPFAAAEIAAALGANPTCQFLYTDEVVADGKLRPVDYFLKPAWDPVLLSGVNYINHLSLYRRDRLLAIGGLRDGFQGSQDYDLLLRYTAELSPNEILHLPFPAYLWRRDGASYSAKFLETATANARKALAEAYAVDRRAAVIDEALDPNLHRIRFDVRPKEEWPLVSIVIPNRDTFPLIAVSLDGVLEKTDYPNLEIIVVDNGSIDAKVLELYERFAKQDPRFSALVRTEPFNFSRSVNRGIKLARGEAILLLNNDVEILDPDWLKEMVSCLDYPDAGVVGAKLLYPDRTIQHVGVIAGLGGLAGHWFIDNDENFPGPMGRLNVRQSLSVVTGACMLISRKCLQETGDFDEDVFGIAYNDVDFCLRAGEKGFRVVWTPFARLIHHESASRGSDEAPDNIERFRRDQTNLRSRHRTDRIEDRALNPWYSKNHSFPTPVLLQQLPSAR